MTRFDGLAVEAAERPRVEAAGTFREVCRQGRTLWCALVLATLIGCGEEQGIDPPVPLFGDVPVLYPISLWDADIEGEVLLRTLVNDLGGVDSVEVLESSGYAMFDTAAVRGAREVRFQPARRGMERVTVWTQVPVYFSKRPWPNVIP